MSNVPSSWKEWKNLTISLRFPQRVEPPYFPEPETVSDNVAEKPYDLRLKFIKTVSIWFMVAGGVSNLSVLLWPQGLNWRLSGSLLLVALLSLNMVRRLASGKGIERIFSWLLILPIIALCGTFFNAIYHFGFPSWALAIVPIGTGLYALISGRDFSFTGQWLLATIFMVFVAIVAQYALNYNLPSLAWGIVLGSIVQFYVSYDSAMILKRRRLSDWNCAVTDLFADSLNFTTYSIRVALHWKIFKAAQLPPEGAVE